MKLGLCSHSSKLTISEAASLKSNFNDASSLLERISSIELGSCINLQSVNLDFLFNYDIFPNYIMQHELSWSSEKRPMHPGDVIIQRVITPPLGFGVCMDFAVKIRELYNRSNRVGFSYETLEGHAEMGISEFYFEIKDESIFFTIHTYSSPGHWSSQLFKFLALPYQAWCTSKAMKHVKRRYIETNFG